MHRRIRFKTARLSLSIVFLAFSSVGNSEDASVIFEDNFVAPAPTEHNWNFCQLAKRLSNSWPGADGQARSAYRLGINRSWAEPTCDCNKRSGCESLTAEEAAYYGPDDETDEETALIPVSSLSPSEIETLKQKQAKQCNGYNKIASFKGLKKKVQKNELRLWSDDWFKAGTGHWYSFRFKIDGKIDTCGSHRWVGGQFKAKGMDNSPFIAQRFDNGVFHVTIEAPHHTEFKYERVIVAKALGNPDLTLEHFEKNSKATVTCDMSSGTPRPSDCGFAGKVTTADKRLPSIKNGNWIQMDYYIGIGGPCERCEPEKCPRRLEIWAQGEKIAEVTGRFGAVNAHDSELKFKFGVYRDRQPGDAGFVIDDLTIRSDPEKKWSPELRIQNDE